MIELAFAMLLTTWTPGPNDPVCEPGQVVEIDHCAQGQLPEESIGRIITDENDVDHIVVGVDPVTGDPQLETLTPLPAAPAPVSTDPAVVPEQIAVPTPPPSNSNELAMTGVKEEPYLVASGALILLGLSLLVLRNRMA